MEVIYHNLGSRVVTVSFPPLSCSVCAQRARPRQINLLFTPGTASTFSLGRLFKRLIIGSLLKVPTEFEEESSIYSIFFVCCLPQQLRGSELPTPTPQLRCFTAHFIDRTSSV